MYTPCTYKRHTCRYKHNCVLYTCMYSAELRNIAAYITRFWKSPQSKITFHNCLFVLIGAETYQCNFSLPSNGKMLVRVCIVDVYIRVLVYSIWLQYAVPIKFTSNLNATQFYRMCISCITCTPSTWTDKVNNFCICLVCVYTILNQTQFATKCCWYVCSS